MMPISRAAAMAALTYSISSLVIAACYDPCDYPGETSAMCGGGNGAATTTNTGGGCEACAAMSTTCQSYTCVEGACKPAEPTPTTVSCGDGDVCDGLGSCVPCNLDADCQATAASTDMRCHEHACFSCADGAQNGNELGIDCGGSCLACLGAACAAATECKSASCAKGACLLPSGASCSDHSACATGLCDPTSNTCSSCTGQGQCKSTQCNAGSCKAPHGAPCGDDADCANGTCDTASKLCLKPNGDTCSTAYECASGFCSTTCAACAADADCLGTKCLLTTGTCALPQQAYCTPGVTSCADGLACGGFPAKCQ